MPEYLAPGVYVEETSFRAKSIEGVSTTTTGFIGPTRYGSVTMEPDIVTSLGEFERVYGDGQQLEFNDGGTQYRMHNYVWHAVRGFFEEGGKRLYIVRTFLAADANGGYARAMLPATSAQTNGDAGLPVETRFADALQLRARFPGAAGNLRVRFTLRPGQNVLGFDTTANVATIGALQENDIVWIGDVTSPISSPPGGGNVYRAGREFDPDTERQVWFFFNANGDRVLALNQVGPMPGLDPRRGDQVRVVTLLITVFPPDPNNIPVIWDNLALDPNHQQFGAPDAVSAIFGRTPPNRSLERTLPLLITLGDNINNGLELLTQLNQASTSSAKPGGILDELANPDATDASRSFDVMLTGGNDGARPGVDEYQGDDSPNQQFKTGLKAFEDIEDISIVAAPGATYNFENTGYNATASTIVGLLISHAERMRYRIAVLDAGNNQTIAEVRSMRAKLDSKYAALYYPWVRILDPITRREIHLPPSGFVSGIYARNDVNRAVYKAPANEVVNLAIGFEQLLNKGQQDVLNPEGINCFRYFEGRGFRLWGARTISSDPEWKYVNLRRYFAYVERSIDRGTQWVVFEPNGEALWANVRRTVEDFLLNEWQSGALLGDKPEKAYFVRCDRSTMTQNDLDNGRLICLIGIAPLRPAEFVIFRIGQWTGDRKG